MNCILLYSLILAIFQLTFGKTITTAASHESESSSTSKDNSQPIIVAKKSAEENDARVRRSSTNDDDNDDFLINQLSREYDIMTSNLIDTPPATCNNLNDLESDMVMEGILRSLYDPQCSQMCRIEILAKTLDAIKCNEMKTQNIIYERERRAKLGPLTRDDLFIPVRGRRGSDMDLSSSPRISAEKKAKLDVLMNDLFVPHRGKRQLVRKHFLLFDPYTNTFDKRASNTIDLNMKDYFVAHRGKRQRSKIDEILSETFLPQRGKKAFTSATTMPTIIPKSHHTIVEYDSMDPTWLFQNINSDDGHMIDRLHDLNLIEANKDITTAAVAATARGEKFIPQMYFNNDEKKTKSIVAPTTLILNRGSDEFASSDGSANLILSNTPLDSHHHAHAAAVDDFTSTFI